MKQARRSTRTGKRASLATGLLGILMGLVSGMPAMAAAKERLVVDLVAEPSSLDPQVQWNPDSYAVYRNIFDNLVTRDDQGNIAGEVAISWKYLSDTEIEFQLRDDILFHDGTHLTAEDVVFSVQRITDPHFASPQLGQFDKIVKAEAVGSATVKLGTNGPYPAVLAQLVKLSIVPKHLVQVIGNDAFNLKPVGSGPYAFESWRRGVDVTLVRNDRYWGKKGVFDRAVFRAVPNAATRLADLQAGTADLVMALDNDLASQLQTSSNAKRLSVLTERLAYLRLNPTKPPFDDPRIRQAVALAIDKQGIVQGILGGYDRPIGEMVTPVHFGWVEGIEGPPYDPRRAASLVHEAGDAAKVEIPLTTAPFFDQRVVQAIQQMLVEVGLNVKIELIDTASFLQRTQRGPRDSPVFAISRSSCACQDADGALFQLFHTNSSWTIVENADLDTWLDSARSTLDPAQRLEDYRRVHLFIAKELPVVPLYQTVATYGAAKQLSWTPTPNESLFLNRMAWKE